MESTVNKLIEIKKSFSFLVQDKNLKQSARDAHADKVAALTDAIEILVDQFDLKLCDSCGAAFEKSPDLDAICGNCEEHKAARLASYNHDFETSRTNF
jgi:hypothetical protein